jgi:hypothetical protein
MRRPGQGGGAEPNDRGSIAPKFARPQYLDEWTGEFVVTNASRHRMAVPLLPPAGHAGWRTVPCFHDLQCDPPEYVRTAVLRWFCVARGRRASGRR